MELKRVKEANPSLCFACLLIVPYGIETMASGLGLIGSASFNCTLWN